MQTVPNCTSVQKWGATAGWSTLVETPGTQHPHPHSREATLKCTCGHVTCAWDNEQRGRESARGESTGWVDVRSEPTSRMSSGFRRAAAGPMLLATKKMRSSACSSESTKKVLPWSE